MNDKDLLAFHIKAINDNKVQREVTLSELDECKRRIQELEGGLLNERFYEKNRLTALRRQLGEQDDWLMLRWVIRAEILLARHDQNDTLHEMGLEYPELPDYLKDR